MLLQLAFLGCSPHAGRAPIALSPAEQLRPAEDGSWAVVEAYVRAESARRHLPRLEFAFACRGEIALRGVYDSGKAPGGSFTSTTDTYRLGSLTKLVTGVALLQLRDAGLLRLDDELATYVREADGLVYPPGSTRRVTLRDLVAHTSGIPRMGSIDYTTRKEGLTEAELLGELAELRLEFSPGTQTRYSNLAMALGGLVVERVSGRSYRAYVTEHILAPLEMHGAVWDPDSIAPPRRLVPGQTVPSVPVRVPARLGALDAAGGLYATLDDVEKFMLFELGGARTTGPSILGPASLRESQMVDQARTPEGPSRFGVTWRVEEMNAVGPVVTQIGSTFDYAASLMLSPSRHLGVTMLLALGEPGVLGDVSAEALQLAAVACSGLPRRV